MSVRWPLAVAPILVLLGGAPAGAHREDYLDETPVFLTLERGELEPEYWFDLGGGGGVFPAFVRHNLALEAALTEHWMCDVRATLRRDRGGPHRFEAARAETRVRFGEEGERPVDLAASAEVNVEREADGAWAPGVEPRLILSRDWSAWNLTVNLPLEIGLDGSTASFDPTLGVRWGTGRFRAGAEAKWFGRERSGALIPQLWVELWEGGTFKTGWSQGVGRDSESFLRLALETEL